MSFSGPLLSPVEKMGSYSLDIVPKIEAILANAKQLKHDDLSARLGLMTQVDRLYQDLESPIELVSFTQLEALWSKQ